ncbi:glyceraldehyde-3-phosphate dehydrogenase, partial [Halomonas sp. 707D4]|nr:glyceraldehyde-3-phosphate dehydrogenase [Halomonas sp. 707D4]
MSQQTLENVFQKWQSDEALAEQMIPLVGKLYRQNNVVATMFGRSLIKKSVIRILKDHRFVRKIEGTELSVQDTFPIVEAMAALNLGPAHVDIGKLAVAFKHQGGGDLD